MAFLDWVEGFPGSVIVCDRAGTILAMNDRAALGYEVEGGRDLIGRNLLDCHPEPARYRALSLLTTGSPNIYTIEKNGIRKLIYQCPWYRAGTYAGLVELSLEIPAAMPHFVRAPKPDRSQP